MRVFLGSGRRPPDGAAWSATPVIAAVAAWMPCSAGVGAAWAWPSWGGSVSRRGGTAVVAGAAAAGRSPGVLGGGVGTAVSLLVGWFAVQARLPLDLTGPGLFPVRLCRLRGLGPDLRTRSVAAVADRRADRRLGCAARLLARRRAGGGAIMGGARPLPCGHRSPSGRPRTCPATWSKDASPFDHDFHYALVPAGLASVGAGGDAYTVATSTMSVGVRRLPARFAPQKRCNRDDAYPPDQSSTAAGPSLWRGSKDPRNVVYLARRRSAWRRAATPSTRNDGLRPVSCYRAPG
ncbi:hypothetical protein DFJ69_0297 [Thermomonospora umbrina]|uniref:Uncharacterized protein n=1 Tax=Thermomonospora umbrina TaxID=111806 RepID=A0A3D9SG84_9ACTN|nr:hypothetical protein DFJ69_0297 [Thermomonospora umbrina]